MSLPRRQLLQLMAGAAALPIAPRVARAQAYPSKPIRLVVQVGAGSAPDIIARVAGQWLSDHLGQPVVIDNRPGASGNIATEAVVRSRAGRLHAAVRHVGERHQRFAVRQPALQLRARHRAGGADRAHPAGDGGSSVRSGQDRSGVHRLRQGQSGQDQHGFERQRDAAACGRRAVQADGRRRSRPRGVSRRAGGTARPFERAGADHVRCVPSSLPYIKNGQMRALAVSTEQRLDVLPDVPPMADICRATRRVAGTASWRRRTRRRRSSSGSTRR